MAADTSTTNGTELTLQWVTNVPPDTGTLSSFGDVAAVVNRFDILSRRAVQIGPVVERDPQLSNDDLVIVAVNRAGREVGWERVKDSRIVRSEQPAPDARLSGRVLYRVEAELVVWLPGRLQASELRVYKPEWNGFDFTLIGLGTVDLR